MGDKKVAIISFPGTNCDYDIKAVYDRLGIVAEIVRNQELTDLSSYDLVVLPGGFSYGDYLRPGAIAKFAPLMRAVINFAENGGFVIGICNGFQILCEAQLLPGVLLVNKTLKFQSKTVPVEIVSNNSFATSGYQTGDTVHWPIANFSGCYTVSNAELNELRENDQILIRYMTDENGSSDRIAGVCNVNRNVVGVMPHPERVVDQLIDITGTKSGLPFFAAFVA